MKTCPKEVFSPSTHARPTASRPGCRQSRFAKPAFTLVEMLVVIVIIAILAGLISVAAANAMYQAKNARIRLEVENLGQAVERFKDKYGDYPPCNLQITSNTPNTAGYNLPLRNFIAKAWRNYDQTNLIADLQSSGVDTNSFRPDCALVFWLSGFSADVTNPFVGPGGPGDASNAAKQPFFPFDPTRLWPPSIAASATLPTAGAGQAKQPVSGYAFPGGQIYLPPTGNTAFPTPAASGSVAAIASSPIPPYVFFDWQSYGTLSTYSPGNFAYGNAGTATPYVRDVNANGTFEAATDTWANPTSYQIICAGQDNIYGSSNISLPRLFPGGLNYDSAGTEDDNITNFVTGRSTLGDSKP